MSISSVETLLEELKKRKVEIVSSGGTIKLKAPPGSLTESLKKAIVKHKRSLVELAQQDAFHDQSTGGLVAEANRTTGPLSFAQQRIWFVQKLEENCVQFNVAGGFRIKENFDQQCFDKTIQFLIDRHSSLRTLYVEDGGEVSQKLVESYALPIERKSLATGSKTEREQALFELAEADAQRPFDLTTELPIRVTDVTLSPGDHAILLSLHHIAVDGVSLSILMREFGQIYQALSIGTEPDLGDLPIRYLDFSVWQRAFFEEEGAREKIAYWRDLLDGAPEVHSLPTDRPRANSQFDEGGIKQQLLGATLSAKVVDFCREHRVTPSTFFQALYTLWLSKVSEERDIVIGYPSSMRSRSETLALVGLLLNTTLLRVSVPSEATFVDHLKAVHSLGLRAMQHLDVPYELLVEELSPKRDLAHNALYQLWFNYQDQTDQLDELSRLGLAPLIEDGTAEKQGSRSLSFTSAAAKRGGAGFAARNELHLDVTKHGDVFSIDWIFSRSLFEQETIEKYNQSFLTLIEQVIERSHAELADLSLVDDAERSKLLAEWSKGPNWSAQNNDRQERSVNELMLNQAEATPDQDAVKHGDLRLSYRELAEKVDRLAGLLLEQGVEPGKPVGVCAPRSPAVLIAIFAIWKAGGAYVPLDLNHPKDRLKYIIDDCGLTNCLTVSDVMEHLPLEGLDFSLLDGWESDDWLEEFRLPDTQMSPPLPAQLAYVIYTSGSTGRPKGVMVEHNTLSEYLSSAIKTYYSQALEGSLHLGSHCFDLALPGLILPLITGGCVLLAEDGHEDSSFVKAAMSDQGLLYRITPTHLNALLDGLPSALVCDAPHAFVVGGEPFPRGLAERLHRHFPRASVFNHYGPTEATIGSSCYKIDPDDTFDEWLPIGRPLGAARLFVLNSDLEPVPAGLTGELYIGGPVLARGYAGNGNLTSTVFQPDPFSTEADARIYRTGDLVKHLEDGNLQYVGRKDNQLKIRGYRVELSEIEASLQRIDGIANSAVRTISQKGRDKIAAYVEVKAKSNQLTPEIVKSKLRSELPDYMLPAEVVLLDKLPRTANGKVDYSGLPMPEQAVTEIDFKPPTTVREIALCEIWRECLAVDKIGIADNFFELGGDSIMSLQVVARAKQRGIHCTVRQLFENQTIETLLAALPEAEAVARPLVPSEGQQILLPIQREFFSRQIPDPFYFNQSVLLETPPGFQADQVFAFVDKLINAHDVFRLSFEQEGHEWNAYYKADQLLQTGDVVETVDLSKAGESERKGVLEKVCTRLQSSMSLSSPPLLRLAYFDFGPSERGRLFITAHHLIVDGVSWRTILLLLEEVYSAGTSDTASICLPSASYQQYGDLLAEYAFDETVVAQQSFWREQLSLPSSAMFKCGDHGIDELHKVQRTLPVDLTTKIIADCNEAYRTTGHELLLAALLSASRNWAGENGLLVYVEGHGRDASFSQLDLSDCIGWFTAVYPLALTAPPSADLGGVIKSVKEQCRSVPDGGIGFGLLTQVNPQAEIVSRHYERRRCSILFNYLGQLDARTTSDRAFSRAPEPVPPMRAATQKPVEPLSLVLWVEDGSLHFSIEIDAVRISPRSAEKLADAFTQSLHSTKDWCEEILARKKSPSKQGDIELQTRLLGEGIAI